MNLKFKKLFKNIQVAFISIKEIMYKYLITGGAGLIGSNLLRELIKKKILKYMLLTIYGEAK